jgi:hypothetical protein
LRIKTQKIIEKYMEENKKRYEYESLESIILWILVPVCFIDNFRILKRDLMVLDTTGINRCIPVRINSLTHYMQLEIETP